MSDIPCTKLSPDIKQHICHALRNMIDANAKAYVQQGLQKRLFMLNYCMSKINELTPAEGSESLTPDVATALAVCINAFYINVRGSLDNLAWALFYELKLQEQCVSLDASRKQSIGLHYRTFLSALKKQPRGQSCAEALEKTRQWLKDITDKRDPAAHRFPIEMVSGCVSSEDKEKHADLCRQRDEADIENVYNLDCQADQLLVFRPVLLIRDEKKSKIQWAFSALANDFKKMLEVAEVVLLLLANKATQHDNSARA